MQGCLLHQMPSVLESGCCSLSFWATTRWGLDVCRARKASLLMSVCLLTLRLPCRRGCGETIQLSWTRGKARRCWVWGFGWSRRSSVEGLTNRKQCRFLSKYFLWMLGHKATIASPLLAKRRAKIMHVDTDVHTGASDATQERWKMPNSCRCHCIAWVGFHSRWRKL